jgi:hypothetical protein
MINLESGSDQAQKGSGSGYFPGLLVVVKGRTEPPTQLLEALHTLAPQDHSVSEEMDTCTK